MAPSALQLGDGLTKSGASAHDTLRRTLRTGRYQFHSEEKALQERAAERERRQKLGQDRAARDLEQKAEAKELGKP